MNLRDFIISSVARILGRPFSLDPDVPLGTLVQRSLAVATGLVRGAILARRRIILSRGARVRTPSKLRTSGGLVRIEGYCLVDCLSRDGISVGRNFKLGAYSRMIASGSTADLGKGITIGDNVGIGEFSYIGGAGGVVIGADCIIGQYLSVHPENHVFSDSNRLIRDQGVIRQGIEIGPGCWVGAKVTILDGAVIGMGSVIAAGSVVTQSFPDRSVIGGVPARLIKSLSQESKSE
jgi:acetyltransferase-like isoleucine patch superfamily enzyme